MRLKRSVTSLCTVDLLMPKTAAVLRTVFLVSTIYSASRIALSHAVSFKNDSSFSVVYDIFGLPVHYMNGERFYSFGKRDIQNQDRACDLTNMQKNDMIKTEITVSKENAQ